MHAPHLDSGAGQRATHAGGVGVVVGERVRHEGEPGPGGQEGGRRPHPRCRRLPGALLVHGHLDVVPADAAEWQLPPFSGEIRDGYLWGRGAIDMKDTVAVTPATARHFARTGTRSAREIVLAFLADEEAGGRFGAHWLVEHRPELFEGVTEAIGEGGGFSHALDDTRRLYPIESAQRGMAWLELTASGRAGHGSSPNDENAVTDLAESLTRIGRHTFPVRLIEPVCALLAEPARLQGADLDHDAEDLDAELAKLGHVADFMQVVLSACRCRACASGCG